MKKQKLLRRMQKKNRAKQIAERKRVAKVKITKIKDTISKEVVMEKDNSKNKGSEKEN